MAERIILFLRLPSNKTTSIVISIDYTISGLYSLVSEKIHIPVDKFRLFYGSQVLDAGFDTIKDYGIKNNQTILAAITVNGGGDPCSYCDDCSMKGQCLFYKLFDWHNIVELRKKQANAYNLLCHKFNISCEAIRAIEDNSEDSDIRLFDVIHRIYHKHHNITLQDIIKSLERYERITIRLLYGRHSEDIEISVTDTMSNLYSLALRKVASRNCVSGKPHISVDTRIKLIDRIRELCGSGTIINNGIKHYDTIIVCIVQRGGGDGRVFYSYFDDCLMKYQCPFHELFHLSRINQLSINLEDAYDLLCRKFNISDEDIRAIEDNSWESYIRLFDAIHRIYHKDHNITLQDIIEILER